MIVGSNVDTGTEPPQQSTEAVSFVSDARLISVLGEQLIGSEKVGVMELVKNAYDAGAKTCVVTLEGVPGLQPNTRTLLEYAELDGPIVEVRDDGSGMDHDDLVLGWLRPATGRRAGVKERLRRERDAAVKRGASRQYEALVKQLRASHGGRLPLGEKGIGRLATHRLGRFLWLRTKTVEDPFEWQIKIDWNDFDVHDSPVDLADVNVTLSHQAPTTEYGPRGSGTVICCYGGRDGYEWDDAAILELGRSINALRSPYKGPAGFEPSFATPHADEASLASPLDRINAPFELTALVDHDGQAEIEMEFSPPSGVDIPMAKHEETKDLRSRERGAWVDEDGALRTPRCGPFIVHIRSWIRMSQWLGPEYKAVTNYLDVYGGLAVFRDGLAALPAQQTSKGDWLGLAMEQIKKSANISYYHLLGEIELEQEATLDLRDRSSREGMIETAAYRDLVLLARAVVVELQFHMQEKRDEWSLAAHRRSPVPRAKLQADASLLRNVTESLADGYDFKKDPLRLNKTVKGQDKPERLRAAAGRLQSLGEQLKLYDEERDGLLEAAGFGLAIGVAVHEIEKLAAAVLSDAREVKRTAATNDAAKKSVGRLLRRANALRAETTRIAPLRVTRTEAATTFRVRGAIESAKSAFAIAAEDRKIRVVVDGDDFPVVTRFGALTQVFANLIDNALYWISTTSPIGELRFLIAADKRTVLVADSGPGVSPKMQPHLFQPFYSEKSPPSGLGLYICRYYLARCQGRIRTARAQERIELDGAQFLIDLSRTPSGDS